MGVPILPPPLADSSIDFCAKTRDFSEISLGRGVLRTTVATRALRARGLDPVRLRTRLFPLREPGTGRDHLEHPLRRLPEGGHVREHGHPLAAPARAVGHEHVLAEVQLGLEEEPPAARKAAPLPRARRYAIYSPPFTSSETPLT